MKPDKQHAKLKKLLTNEQIKDIVRCSTPDIATDEVVRRGSEFACALIDSTDELTAAFIILVLRQRIRYENDTEAAAIIKRAEKLKIKGLNGLCHARDQLFKKTGILLV